jgi:hypothetical protein
MRRVRSNKPQVECPICGENVVASGLKKHQQTRSCLASKAWKESRKKGLVDIDYYHDPTKFLHEDIVKSLGWYRAETSYRKPVFGRTYRRGEKWQVARWYKQLTEHWWQVSDERKKVIVGRIAASSALQEAVTGLLGVLDECNDDEVMRAMDALLGDLP